MRIGLSGGGSTIERTIEQARQAEADGFTLAVVRGRHRGRSADPHDPGRAGHHVDRAGDLGAARRTRATPCSWPRGAATAANAMERAGLTLGLGPSHVPAVEGMYGLSYDHPGRHTEEYVSIVTRLLRGETVDATGDEFRVRTGAAAPAVGPVPVLVAASRPGCSASPVRSATARSPGWRTRVPSASSWRRPSPRPRPWPARCAARRRRPPDRGARRRRRGARHRGGGVHDLRHSPELPAGAGRRRRRQSRPRRRRRRRGGGHAARSSRSSTQERPTCGRRRSPWATDRAASRRADAGAPRRARRRLKRPASASPHTLTADEREHTRHLSEPPRHRWRGARWSGTPPMPRSATAAPPNDADQAPAATDREADDRREEERPHRDLEHDGRHRYLVRGSWARAATPTWMSTNHATPTTSA